MVVFGEDDINSRDSNIVFVGKGRKKIFKFLTGDTLKLSSIVKKRKVEIIHAHSTFCGIQAIILKCIFPHLKIIYTPHAYYSQRPNLSYFKRRIILFLEKMIVKSSFKIIHVSESEESHAINNKILDDYQKKSHIIYNGVKKPKSRNGDILSKKIRIGSLSRLNEQKNPMRFLELAKAIQEKDSKHNYEFYYGGDGPLKENMQKFIQDNSMEKYCFLLGHIAYENIEEDFFDKIDIYMSTAFYEGMPYSVVEALSYKKPIILSDVIGHKELYFNNGLIFKLEDQNSSIASDIISILEKRGISTLSENSYFHFINRFEIEKNISLIDEVYKGE